MHNRDGSLKEKEGKRGTEIIKGAQLDKHYKDISSCKFRAHKTWKKDAYVEGPAPTTVSTVLSPLTMSRN